MADAPRHRPPLSPLVWALPASAFIAAGILWLIYGRVPARGAAGWTAQLPLLNATFNALAAGLLVAGWRAIRAGHRRRHARLMLAALGASLLFLTSYLTYHYLHGEVRFPGRGAARGVYLAILASHVLLSLALLPLALVTLFHAARGRYHRHRRVARWTLPIWLYVSVTGVVVVLFLRAYL